VVWDSERRQIAFQEKADYKVLTINWVPKLNSMFYVCDDTGGFHLYTTDQDQVAKMQQSNAPKWMRNPVSIEFCSDNTLTTYSQSQSNLLNEQNNEN